MRKTAEKVIELPRVVSPEMLRLAQAAAAGARLTAEEHEMARRVPRNSPELAPRVAALPPLPSSRAAAAAVAVAMPSRRTAARALPGVSVARATSLQISVRCARPRVAEVLDTPEAVAALWRREIEPADWYSPERENLVVLSLSARCGLIGWQLCGVGTARDCAFNVAAVLRPVILSGGDRLTLVHNHPSGLADPSAADRNATRALKASADLMGILVCDHLIFGTAGDTLAAGDAYFSFRENGLL